MKGKKLNMGKKVDLNARRNNNSRITKNNRNLGYYNNNINSNTSSSSSSNEEFQNNTTADLGLPSYNQDYDFPKKADIKIKFPTSTKIILTALIAGFLLIGLMLFVVIFSKESSTGSGLYALGQTCETVTVTDTKNYKYDSDVSFDEYIKGVVAAESDGNTNLEYLKVLSIYARTYFFENASSDCEVEGNTNFQEYMDVDDSTNSNLVKQAVDETKDLVITYDGELLEIDYSLGCLVNKDSNYYYIRYNELISGETKYQKILTSLATSSKTNTELNQLYQNLDKSETNYQNRLCPENTTDDGMSKIGAIYLITNNNYDYQSVIKYYNGSDVEIIKNAKNHSGNGDFINPTSTIFCSSPYGNRISPITGKLTFHYGVDIALSQGTPIYATKDGEVTYVEKNITAINNCDYSYGNYVIIDHGDGLSTLYGHMKYGSIPDSISIGSSVSQGDEIGRIGSTGCSTGYHLHYEVRENGSNVDPADYLDLTDASGICQR